jgi:hypothetical protein
MSLLTYRPGPRMVAAGVIVIGGVALSGVASAGTTGVVHVAAPVACPAYGWDNGVNVACLQGGDGASLWVGANSYSTAIAQTDDGTGALAHSEIYKSTHVTSQALATNGGSAYAYNDGYLFDGSGKTSNAAARAVSDGTDSYAFGLNSGGSGGNATASANHGGDAQSVTRGGGTANSSANGAGSTAYANAYNGGRATAFAIRGGHALARADGASCQAITIALGAMTLSHTTCPAATR